MTTGFQNGRGGKKRRKERRRGEVCRAEWCALARTSAATRRVARSDHASAGGNLAEGPPGERLVNPLLRLPSRGSEKKQNGREIYPSRRATGAPLPRSRVVEFSTGKLLVLTYRCSPMASLSRVIESPRCSPCPSLSRLADRAREYIHLAHCSPHLGSRDTLAVVTKRQLHLPRYAYPRTAAPSGDIK